MILQPSADDGWAHKHGTSAFSSPSFTITTRQC